MLAIAPFSLFVRAFLLASPLSETRLNARGAIASGKTQSSFITDFLDITSRNLIEYIIINKCSYSLCKPMNQ